MSLINVLTAKAKREAILTRDRYQCAHCGSVQNLTMDHVIPKAVGGTNHINNLQTLCGGCNKKKGCEILPPTGHRKNKKYYREFWRKYAGGVLA